MKHVIKLAACLAITTATLVPVPSYAALTGLDNMFVFGDSLSDGGNSGIAAYSQAGVVFPDFPYAAGKYTNGDTAFEYLWNAYNPAQALIPSLAGGTNFAIGGATTGHENFNAVNSNVPGVLQPAFEDRSAAWQLGEFQNYLSVNGAFNPATSLFGVWLFPNDIFYSFQEGILPGTVPGSPGGLNVVENGIANIVTLISTLAALGAENFLVPNMADLGIAPEFLGTSDAGILSFITQQFNLHLADQLNLLSLAFPNIDIIQVDVAGTINQIVANPSAYGFTNVTERCVTVSGICSNPDEYLFWDGVHPTTVGHRLIGEQFLAAVSIPEPEVITLLMLGFVAMRLIHRKKTRTLASEWNLAG